MDASWIDCAFEVEGERVEVAVRRLTADERQRMSAEIAWHADVVLTSKNGARPSGWSVLLERILAHNVAITISEDVRWQSKSAWDELVCRVFEMFVIANDLDAPIRRHLCSERNRSCA